MTRFLRLRGPGYDLAAMNQARRELEVLLESPPDRQDFVDEARETLRTVDDWIAQHHVLTANYYRTLDNPRGEVIYLRKACEPPRQDTDAGKEALRRLAALEGSLPAQPAATESGPTGTGGGP